MNIIRLLLDSLIKLEEKQMNLWIIAGIVVGALLIGGFAINNFVAADSTQEEAQVASCQSCGNSCTADNNCGLASCGAVNGKSCSCGK